MLATHRAVAWWTVHHLCSAGVSVVVDTDPRGLPVVLHWGRALPDEALDALAVTRTTAPMSSALDVPSGPTVAASGADGWSGVPAFAWHASGVAPAALSGTTRLEGAVLTAALTEPRTGGSVVLRYRLHPGGVLQADAELENTGDAPIDLTALRLLLPLPDSAPELLDFTGA